MRLGRPGPPRPQIQVFPLGSLSLLVFTALVIVSMYSAARGPGLRFASVDRDGRFREADALRVDVLSDQEMLVDGTPVPLGDLAVAVSERLSGRDQPAVLLVVSPEASYGSMVVAYGAIAALPSAPRIAFPARPWRSL